MYELCIEKQTVETTRLVCGVSRVPDGEGAWSQSPDSMGLQGSEIIDIVALT